MPAAHSWKKLQRESPAIQLANQKVPAGVQHRQHALAPVTAGLEAHFVFSFSAVSFSTSSSSTRSHPHSFSMTRTVDQSASIIGTLLPSPPVIRPFRWKVT